MKIGELNNLVTLQYKTRASDSMGGFTETWADSSSIWAAVWPTSAKEMIQGLKPTGEITHRIRIRYRRGVSASHRIKFGNRYFDIVSPPINPNESNEWLDLICREQT